MKIVKNNWPILIVFGVVFAILMVDLNPDVTFMNKAADSIGYLYSAKYLYPAYHTSAPLYLLLGHVFLQIPIGTDAWRMGLISVLSTMIACLFIYLAIKKQTGSTVISGLGVLIYGTSALVISQSTIVNTYALISMLAAGAYYFALVKKWKLVAVFLGMAIATHLLGFIVLLIMFLFYKEYRKNWRALGITASFILLYAYVPITSRPPYMWLPNPGEVNTVQAFIADTISVIAMIVGTLGVWDIPKRILDTIGLVGLSMGIITIVSVIYYFRHNIVLKNPAFWLIITPITLFVSELDMNTYDYTMVALPFLTIVSCVGLSMMVEKHLHAVLLAIATVAVVGGLGIFNANYFDLGRTLDPNMATAKLFYQEFAKVPDGAILMPNYGYEWEAIYKYNRDYGRNIYPICKDVLPSETYRKMLRQDGVKIEDSQNENLSNAAAEMAQSIIRLNDNVYTTISVDPYTYESVVVAANHDESLIPMMDKALILKNATNPDWKWKPWNPYDIITARLFVNEWGNMVLSQYNFRLFLALFLSIYLVMIYAGRGKKKVKNEVISETETEETT